VSDGDRSRAVRLARKLIRVEEEVIPVLYVEDAGRAVACYGRLGFHKQWEHQFEEGFPWFVSVARGRVRLYRTRIGEMPEGGEVEVVAPGISHQSAVCCSASQRSAAGRACPAPGRSLVSVGG
jgi:hypothetical protein